MPPAPPQESAPELSESDLQQVLEQAEQVGRDTKARHVSTEDSAPASKKRKPSAKGKG